MELTPNTRPLEMTIGQLFAQLTVVMENATPEERERFKRTWLDGAERMKRERTKTAEFLSLPSYPNQTYQA